MTNPLTDLREGRKVVVDDWQPIDEKTPRDRPILAPHEKACLVVWWDDNACGWTDGGTDRYDEPYTYPVTHWKPQPELPGQAASPDHTAALLAHIDAVEAERNTFKAKSLSRGKLLERFRDHIQNMCDHAEDDGDRVYFGSTNDLDDLREIAREMDDWKWDAIMRERPEPDPYKLCRENLARAKAAERKLAEAIAELREIADADPGEFRNAFTDLMQADAREALRALVKGNQDAAE